MFVQKAERNPFEVDRLNSCTSQIFLCNACRMFTWELRAFVLLGKGN